MTKPGRIPCCVPFCRRTARDEGIKGQEVICGKHWRLADRTLTRRYKRLQRRCDNLMAIEPEQYSEAERQRVVRLFQIVRRMWERIKHQSIERAVGIA
jgi:hypothetical protein